MNVMNRSSSLKVRRSPHSRKSSLFMNSASAAMLHESFQRSKPQGRKWIDVNIVKEKD